METKFLSIFICNSQDATEWHPINVYAFTVIRQRLVARHGTSVVEASTLHVCTTDALPSCFSDPVHHWIKTRERRRTSILPLDSLLVLLIRVEHCFSGRTDEKGMCERCA